MRQKVNNSKTPFLRRNHADGDVVDIYIRDAAGNIMYTRSGEPMIKASYQTHTGLVKVYSGDTFVGEMTIADYEAYKSTVKDTQYGARESSNSGLLAKLETPNPDEDLDEEQPKESEETFWDEYKWAIIVGAVLLLLIMLKKRKK